MNNGTAVEIQHVKQIATDVAVVGGVRDPGAVSRERRAIAASRLLVVSRLLRQHLGHCEHALEGRRPEDERGQPSRRRMERHRAHRFRLQIEVIDRRRGQRSGRAERDPTAQERDDRPRFGETGDECCVALDHLRVRGVGRVRQDRPSRRGRVHGRAARFVGRRAVVPRSVNGSHDIEVRHAVGQAVVAVNCRGNRGLRQRRERSSRREAPEHLESDVGGSARGQAPCQVKGAAHHGHGDGQRRRRQGNGHRNDGFGLVGGRALASGSIDSCYPIAVGAVGPLRVQVVGGRHSSRSQSRPLTLIRPALDVIAQRIGIPGDPLQRHIRAGDDRAEIGRRRQRRHVDHYVQLNRRALESARVETRHRVCVPSVRDIHIRESRGIPQHVDLKKDDRVIGVCGYGDGDAQPGERYGSLQHDHVVAERVGGESPNRNPRGTVPPLHLEIAWLVVRIPLDLQLRPLDRSRKLELPPGCGVEPV